MDGQQMENDDTDFIRCEVCNLLFNSVKPYEEHVRGSKHQKKLKTLRNREISGSKDDEDEDQIHCTVCDTTFSGLIPFKQHLTGSRHTKALKRRKLQEDKTANEGDEIEDEDEMDEDLIPKPFATCSVCMVDLSGPEAYQSHMTGKSHKKKLKEEKILKQLREAKLVPDKPSTKENENESGDETDQKGENSLLAQLATVANGEDSADKILFCEQCDKSFSGPAPFLQHMVSKLHKKKLGQIKTLIEVKTELSKQVDGHSSEEESDVEEEVLACVTCGVAFSGPESMMAHLKSKAHKKKISFQKLKAKVARASSNADQETKPEYLGPSAQTDQANADTVRGLENAEQSDEVAADTSGSGEPPTSQNGEAANFDVADTGAAPRERSESKKKSKVQKMASAVIEIMNDM